MSFIPRLEWLETREMLDANAIDSAAGALQKDMTRAGNDMATSEHSLVNTIQLAQTNKLTPAALANQVIDAANELSADFGRIKACLTTKDLLCTV